MPKNRPGRIYYTTATKAVLHGAPCIEDGIPGVAVKQAEPSSLLGRDDVTRTTVGIGEPFAIIDKGIVEVANVVGFAKGDAVYIAAGTNVISETNTGVKFGTVVELPLERGTPTGKCRIDLDLK